LKGPWWDYWDAFMKNAPLMSVRNVKTPLLMVHGDRDPAAPFSQAVEFFNTLQRAGKKAMVLLQYAGEEHSFSPAAERDSGAHMEEFFDHFLKGAPAPTWWSDGVSYYEGLVPDTHAN
jgi:dipeptidyl aminopeptidase/acylaminoacyl peptidase